MGLEGDEGKRIAAETVEKKSEKKVRGRGDIGEARARKTWHARSKRIWTVSVNHQDIALTSLSPTAKAQNSLETSAVPHCGKTSPRKKRSGRRRGDVEELTTNKSSLAKGTYNKRSFSRYLHLSPSSLANFEKNLSIKMQTCTICDK